MTTSAGSYAKIYIIAFGITSAAEAFFLYVLKHGGIIARIFGGLGLLLALLNGLNLLWAIAGQYGLHAT